MARRRQRVVNIRQREQAPLKHGLQAKSKSAIDVRWRAVRSFCTIARKTMPWLTASDQKALAAWAELEFMAAAAFAELRNGGLMNEHGEPRTLITTYRQLRATALQYARELGATPASRAALGALISDARESDLASELAQIRLAKAREKPKDITPLELPSDAS